MFHAAALLLAVRVPNCFFHVNIQQALLIVQDTHQSVSVPIRHPSDKSSVVTSFETDVSIHRKYNKMPGMINTRYTHACGVWVIFPEHGGGALGVFKSPAYTYTYNQSWTFVRMALFLLLEQA